MMAATITVCDRIKRINSVLTFGRTGKGSPVARRCRENTQHPRGEEVVVERNESTPELYIITCTQTVRGGGRVVRWSSTPPPIPSDTSLPFHHRLKRGGGKGRLANIHSLLSKGSPSTTAAAYTAAATVVGPCNPILAAAAARGCHSTCSSLLSNELPYTYI